MKKTYRTKEELKSYFGRYLNQVETRLQNGSIKTTIKKVEVCDLLDFNKMVKPSEGCDMIINNYSANSDYIYNINKGLFLGANEFSLKQYKQIYINTFCEDDQVKEIEALQISEIKKAIKNVKTELSAQILELDKIRIKHD
jgi:hypothetical protein